MPGVYCEIDVITLTSVLDECAAICGGPSGMSTVAIVMIAVLSVLVLAVGISIGSGICRDTRVRRSSAVTSRSPTADQAADALTSIEGAPRDR
jgi:hypothetical protein